MASAERGSDRHGVGSGDVHGLVPLGRDNVAASELNRRQSLKHLATLAIVLAVSPITAASRPTAQDPQPNCFGEDTDCGIQLPGYEEPTFKRDSDCTDSMTGVVGEGRDADCGKNSSGGGVHKDNDCGKAGLLYKNQDGDCGKQGSSGDADCNNSNGPGNYNSDSACTGSGNGTDNDCDSPAGTGMVNVDGDDSTQPA